METIDINEVFAQANVVENLKNFAGIDAQNALGMMSQERLAAVVGGNMENKTGFFAAKYNTQGEGIENTAKAVASKTLELLPNQDALHFSVIVFNGVVFYVTGYFVNRKKYGRIKVCCYIATAEKNAEYSINDGPLIKI